jgi:hypothetical protein
LYGAANTAKLDSPFGIEAEPHCRGFRNEKFKPILQFIEILFSWHLVLVFAITQVNVVGRVGKDTSDWLVS